MVRRKSRVKTATVVARTAKIAEWRRGRWRTAEVMKMVRGSSDGR
jgi:hypothetical protein